MRTTIALGAVAFAVAVLAVPGTSAPAVALATCQGETATHVGTSGGTVIGTPGHDVVVSNLASTIETLGGDDLVCVTGDRSGRVSIDTGPGDDDVRVLGHTAVGASLGDGEDAFVGGPLDDHVYGGWSDDEHEYDIEYDHIVAGGGYDRVTAGDCNNFTTTDDVDLGPGGGEVFLLGHGTAPGADIDGGPDGNSRLRVACEPRGPWTLDNTDPEAGTAVAEDGTTFTWSGFTGFDLTFEKLTFIGGDRNESFDSYAAVDVDMGGGDDELVVRRTGVEAADVRGGTGRDTLTFDTYYAGGGVSVDVAAGAAAWTETGEETTFSGFERHGGLGDVVEVLGSPRADDLFGTSCRLTVRGGPGSDVIRALDPLEDAELCPGSTRRMLMGGDHGDRIIGDRQIERIHGGAGSDTIFAGPGGDRVQGDAGNDELNGGRGRDTVLGGAGRDVCREAETRRGCER